MKKIHIAALTVLILSLLCSCGINIGKKEETTTTTATQRVTYSFVYTTQAEETQSFNNITDAAEPQQSGQPEEPVAEPQSEATTTAVKTYYSDNPDNRYIAAVADRYGVDRSCLVAFIRANSSTPGANVLQFRGNRDSSGNLITTADELVYVYDVFDNGTFRKTNKDATDTEGYSGIPFANVAAKAEYKLTVEKILPDIEKYKTESKYRYD
jgi:hypothetical protein